MKAIEGMNYGKETLSQLAAILEEQSKSPYDIGYWIDYLFKYGADHLRPNYNNDMNLVSKFDADIGVFLMACTVLILYVQWKCLMCCLRCCCCKKSKKPETPGDIKKKKQ